MRVINPVEITDDNFVSSIVEEDDYDEWVIDTTYGVGDKVIVTTGYHKIYESLRVDNVGNFPPDFLSGEVPWWMEVSSTNRWKMFDGLIESQTTEGSFIEVSLLPGKINSIAFLNIVAMYITVIMTDPVAGEVYNETISFQATEDVLWGDGDLWGDVGNAEERIWQGGNDEELVEKVALRTDLPNYPQATLQIIIAGAEGTAACGKVIIGTTIKLGDTKWSPSVGMIDYSTKTQDSFGNYVVQIRSFSKKVGCIFQMETAIHSEILRKLAQYRATPLLWILSETYNVSLIYGFYKDFDMNVTNNFLTDCNINIEGLI